MAGSQKITLWGPQRTPLGILRDKWATTSSFTLLTVLIQARQAMYVCMYVYMYDVKLRCVRATIIAVEKQ